MYVRGLDLFHTFPYSRRVFFFSRVRYLSSHFDDFEGYRVCLSALFIKKSGATRAFCFRAPAKKKTKLLKRALLIVGERGGGVGTITMN